MFSFLSWGAGAEAPAVWLRINFVDRFDAKPEHLVGRCCNMVGINRRHYVEPVFAVEVHIPVAAHRFDIHAGDRLDFCVYFSEICHLVVSLVGAGGKPAPGGLRSDAEEATLGEPAEVGAGVVPLQPFGEVEDDSQLVLARYINQNIVAVDVGAVRFVELGDLGFGSLGGAGSSRVELAGALGLGEAGFDFLEDVHSGFLSHSVGSSQHKDYLFFWARKQQLFLKKAIFFFMFIKGLV